MDLDKVKSLLRLAQKGRMVEIGRTAVSILIKRKRASLILLSLDASEKLKREIELECRRNNITLYIFSSSAEFGKLFEREAVAVVGISDNNLANGIKNALL